MIAPLWSDVYLPSGNGNLWYRETADPQLLYYMDKYVSDNIDGSCGCSFEPQCAFVVTWENVTSFCDTEDYAAQRDNLESEVNEKTAKEGFPRTYVRKA